MSYMCSAFFFTHYGNIRDTALPNKDWPKVGAKSDWRRYWAQGPLWASLWHPGCWSSIIIGGVRFPELFTKSLFYRHWQPDCSIVAIHGIGAHPDDTWCTKLNAEGTGERYINWISDPDMLPAVVPRARLYSECLYSRSTAPPHGPSKALPKPSPTKSKQNGTSTSHASSPAVSANWTGRSVDLPTQPTTTWAPKNK